MSYNGGAIIAMKGKECVAIASDLRYGIQAQTISFDFQKVFQMNDKLFLGLAGFASDVQTVYVLPFQMLFALSIKLVSI